MKALITGAGGFVGGHLLTHLRQSAPDLELHGTLISEVERRPLFGSIGCTVHILDLRDLEATHALISDLRPDRVFHLAGQAFVPRSFEAPWETLEINIRGTLSILEAIHTLSLPARVLVVSSADIYGPTTPDELPLTEQSPFRPTSPYSVSKIAQDMLACQYAQAFKIHAVRTRPFNHIGPGQNSRFAIPDWASQIAAAEIGLRKPVVEVGNLSASRDFTDVRDVVRGYALALEKGTPGDVFNVCSGQPHIMQHILELLVGLSTIHIDIVTDAGRVRPVDTPVLYGDYTLLRERTGWQPEISLEQSLRDVLDEWRSRLRNPASASSTSI